ncbi:transporter substrate-binding domain-containing protein, partial [Escherichia coli]|nr:transporter substrate-binding domain-containing protein [Escherichia coli]
ADRNRSHWSTSKTPSYTKSVSWQHHQDFAFAGSSVKDKKYFGDGTGVGLRKDDAELTAAFNKALGELRQDGTYDKMAKKYFDFNVYGD